MDSNIIAVILSSAAGAAAVTSIGQIIINRLNRKDTKEDKEVKAGSEIVKKLDNISDEMTALRAEVINNEIDRIRWEILDFANSCRNGRRHTKEEFDHILAQHKKYDKLLKSIGEENGQVAIAFEYIEKLYSKCMEDNDFLA